MLTMVTVDPWPEPKSIMSRRLAGARFRKIYLIGVDGSGKTTLQTELEAGDPRNTFSLHYIRKQSRNVEARGFRQFASHTPSRLRRGQAISEPVTRPSHLASILRICRLVTVEVWVDLRLFFSRTKRVVWVRGFPDVVACPERYLILDAHGPTLDRIFGFLGRGTRIVLIDTPIEVCAFRRPEENPERLKECRGRYLRLLASRPTETADLS